VAERPNQKWIADFTYIWTAEGWLYVAAVIDLFSRRVVGWSIDSNQETSLVTSALGMAIENREPADGAILHSDQGTQGEFNRPSQHLDSGGGKWRRCASDSGRSSCIGDRFHRRVRQRSHGARTESDSGLRSRSGRQPRMLAWQLACHPPLPIDGSVTLVV